MYVATLLVTCSHFLEIYNTYEQKSEPHQVHFLYCILITLVTMPCWDEYCKVWLHSPVKSFLLMTYSQLAIPNQWIFLIVMTVVFITLPLSVHIVKLHN